MRTFRVKMYAAARAYFSVHSGIPYNSSRATSVNTLDYRVRAGTRECITSFLSCLTKCGKHLCLR